METGQPPQRRGFVGRLFNPDKRQMAMLRKRTPAWWVFIFLLTFSVWQILSNPFGFSDLVQRYSQDISNLLLTGPTYGVTNTWTFGLPFVKQRPLGHDNVSVVQVDDRSITRLGDAWPLPYQRHKFALDVLRSYHPRAVVMDMLFVDRRADPTLKELADEIRRYVHDGIPIYILTNDDPPVLQELRNSGARFVDPTIALHQGVARQYPVYDDKPCLKDNPGCRSLAVKVYCEIVNARGSVCGWPNKPAGPKIEIVWGADPDLTERDKPKSSYDNGKPCTKSFGFWGWLRRAVFAYRELRSACPFENVIRFEDLLDGAHPEIEGIVNGRIVFYGASLTGASDDTFTPLNSLLAGVFVHAMALDNLITYAGSPYRDELLIGGVVLDSNAIQIAAIIPVIFILAILYTRLLHRGGVREEDADAPLESIKKEFLWRGIVLALTLAVGLVVMIAGGISLANWVEIVFLAGELTAFLVFGAPSLVWGYLLYVLGFSSGISLPIQE